MTGCDKRIKHFADILSQIGQQCRI